nr:MAG TPA: hypothetical protein [Caudoviricetes sp.]DAJ66886.1 MAG TPA: hypothetical protein [Caudoviricetes sp.]
MYEIIAHFYETVARFFDGHDQFHQLCAMFDFLARLYSHDKG